VCARETDPTFVLFNEEVRFHLSGYVNSHNTYWSVQCPTLIHDFSLYDVTVSAWCDTNGSTTAITGTSFPSEATKSQWYATLQHNLLTPDWYDRASAFSSGTQHSKKFYTLFRQSFWWRKNKQRIVVSTFARSETAWFLRGHIKCTEIILALKTIWKKAFRTLYATFISRTSTCQLNETIFSPFIICI
jgi:hypothetical protein